MKTSGMFDQKPKGPPLIGVPHMRSNRRKVLLCWLSHDLRDTIFKRHFSESSVSKKNSFNSRRSEFLNDFDIDHATKRRRSSHA